MAISLPHKECKVSVNLTVEQVRAIEVRAKRCGVSRGAWMRTILTQAAAKQPAEGYIRIKEPDGSIL